ncbi:uncharacterized protein RJT21DRAFT_112703 [Scheffersomyces amazonensis]|uniref:uncharacterized protein n=1 Tax=Scheffersomyces amazonensis TaxID=1078765 RepID=UPI00315D7301
MTANKVTEKEEPQRFGLESQIKRNPHPDFKKVERERPPFEKDAEWHYTQIPNKDWQVGTGANDSSWTEHKKVSIDPYGEGRNLVDNYKLLIGAITPRPIGFLSTISKEGVTNLAPFSFFTLVNNEPPVFAIGFSCSKANPKDTLRNILETEELTVNIISEWFVEAANFCSTDAPHGVDEFKLAGLTPIASEKVKAPHVGEAAFSVEAKLYQAPQEFNSKVVPNKVTGTLVLVEGIQFHVREDISNESFNIVDISKLKPVSRLGGISYGRTIAGYERLRPDFKKDVVTDEAAKPLLD